MAHAHGGQGMHHPRARCARRGAAPCISRSVVDPSSRGMGLLTAPPPGAARHENQLLRAQSMPACRLDARASARGPRTVHMKTHRRQHVHSLASCWRCALAADAGCGGFRCECRRAQRTSMTTLHASGSGCASPRHTSNKESGAVLGSSPMKNILEAELSLYSVSGCATLSECATLEWPLPMYVRCTAMTHEY